MGALLAFSRGVDRLNAGFAAVADYLVLFAVLISAGNALLRYTLNISSNGALEIQWYMFAGMVLLGASYTLKMNEHVRVDLIYSQLSTRGRLILDIAGFLILFLPVIGYLFTLTLPFFLMSFRSGEGSMNAGGLILWPAKATLPLGFGLLFLQGLSEVIKRVAALKGLIVLETKYEKPLQ
ncbi:TRAP transporter small permease subunit [Antarcticirhabdus aurantiaca]|uniref:TRAP transporter small permease subunit n=1 Tax=Antarcticirhabdus aurantiaca TaxID=2606717 RepID=A0ACD4NK71_9HYPH|nr:TRAP transporter small permease subunit [Antarcticirhabdus aurantiaca]WAJ27282.1 TRAP transporter small permease subunit [Jeongeuplla avenae]